MFKFVDNFLDSFGSKKISKVKSAQEKYDAINREINELENYRNLFFGAYSFQKISVIIEKELESLVSKRDNVKI